MRTSEISRSMFSRCSFTVSIEYRFPYRASADSKTFQSIFVRTNFFMKTFYIMNPVH